VKSRTLTNLFWHITKKIEQLKKDLNITTSDTPEPSSKQADYAKSLAAKNGVTLPDEILADKKK